jgi:glycosyltransferase involved in cell wall biosynthesis
MIRVLHLLGRPERELDLEASECLRVIREKLGPDFEHDTRVTGGSPVWASIGLRRTLKTFDVIHAWDTRAFTAAMLAGADHVVCSTPEGAGTNWLRQVNRAIGRRDVDVICRTAVRRRAIITGGVPPGQCHLIRPPVELREVNAAARTNMRARLGSRDDDYVILVPGESTQASEHELAVWAASILHVVDDRYRALLWGRGPRLQRAAGLGVKLRQQGLVVVAGRKLGGATSYADIIPAADAVVFAARASAPTLPVAMAMAAGVPVIAVATPEVSEFVSEGETALTVSRDEASARTLAQRVLDLRADLQATRAMAARAREHALRTFAAGEFIRQVGALYEQIAARAQPAAAAAVGS